MTTEQRRYPEGRTAKEMRLDSAAESDAPPEMLREQRSFDREVERRDRMGQ